MVFAQVLTDWLTLVTALFASVAAAAALANLWYGALRGPVIDLVGKPDFCVDSVPKNAFTIPMTAEITPSFVFINSGSTTGMIKLRLFFTPSPAFKHLGCCQKCRIIFLNDAAPTGDMSPFFLQERESGIVKVKLVIDFGAWKSHVGQPDGVDEGDICPTLLKADDVNKDRFSKFCSLLTEGRSLGELSVDGARTKRQWAGSWHIIKRKDVIRDYVLFPNEPIRIDKESVRNLKSYLENWDNIQPRRVIEILRNIEPTLESLFSLPERDIRKMIQGQINERGLHCPDMA